MDSAGSSGQTGSSGQIVEGLAAGATGLGLVLFALFPFALPILGLTIVVLLPLLLPLLLLGFLAAMLGGLWLGMRAMTRGLKGLRR